MKNHLCPHCAQPTISVWTKQCLGPARRIRCSECSGVVKVPWSAALSMLPLFLPLYLAYPYDSIYRVLGAVFGVVLGMGLMAYIYHQWVPLIKG